MTWEWVLIAIIAAFAFVYMMFAPKRKTDLRNEHIEPADMRNRNRMETMMPHDRMRSEHDDIDRNRAA
jgi:hypothetical protein